MSRLLQLCVMESNLWTSVSWPAAPPSASFRFFKAGTWNLLGVEAKIILSFVPSTPRSHHHGLLFRLLLPSDCIACQITSNQTLEIITLFKNNPEISGIPSILILVSSSPHNTIGQGVGKLHFRTLSTQSTPCRMSGAMQQCNVQTREGGEGRGHAMLSSEGAAQLPR